MSIYFLTIDAGTGSARAVIFNAQGQQVGLGQQEWQHISEPSVPNSMGFDYQANWLLICHCIQQAIADAEIPAQAIQGITATSMREGIIVYDQQQRPIWGVANVDARASEQVHYLKQHYPNLEAQHYAASGQTFALGMLPRLLWLQQKHPEIYDKAATVSLISDWVLQQLSAEIAVEPSNAGTTGVLNLQTRQWQPELMQQVGLKPSLLPPVLESGTQLGVVTALASQQTGLAINTPIFMGGGDVQLGAAGLGAIHENDCAILGGSFWQQVINLPKKTPPPHDMSLRVNPHVVSHLSQAEGITFFSGLVMRWFRDTFCQHEIVLAQQQQCSPYELLEQKAAQVPPGSHNVLPIFSDAMNYGHWYHAAPSFINLSLDPKRSHTGVLFRALQENACLVSRINLDKVTAFTGIDPKEIIFAGGAAKGKLWPQLLADILEKPVKIPQVTEATALGGAMLCAVATKHYASLEEVASHWVQWQQRYTPNTNNVSIYDELKQRWQAVYAHQRQLVDRGLTQSMWQAPGIKLT